MHRYCVGTCNIVYICYYKHVMTSVVVTVHTYFILLYCNLRIESYEAFVPSTQTNFNTNVLPEYSVELSPLQRS